MSWFSRWFGAYDGSNSSRHRPTKAGVVSFAEDEDKAAGSYGREQLRLECRDLRRNNALIAGLCERFADNVVGAGIVPQAKTSDHAWNEAAEAYFAEWSKIADYRQRVTLWDLQRLAVMARLTDGEIGFVLVENGQLQPIEAERIRTPSDRISDLQIVDGVRVTDTGIKVAYYVHNRNSHGTIDGKNYRSISANDFKHLASIKRTDQVRGIPDLAPVVNAVKDLDEYIGATLLKAKNEAKMFYVVKNQGGAPQIMQQPRRYDTTNNAERPLEKVQTGEIHYLRTNEEMTPIGSNTPGNQFPAFTERIVRIVGAALGLPYEFVMLDFSMGSFSSSRAALLQTYRTFESWQRWLINGMLQPIWNWRIAKAIKEGELPPAPVDSRGVSEWYKVRWQTPEFGWVDPQAENQGHILAINAGASTLSEWCGKRGRDAEDVLREKGHDIATAIEVANSINKQYGTTLTWRDLIITNLPGQVSKQQGAGSEADQPTVTKTDKAEGEEQ
jgi:lambda family phage portal protein